MVTMFRVRQYSRSIGGIVVVIVTGETVAINISARRNPFPQYAEKANCAKNYLVRL